MEREDNRDRDDRVWTTAELAEAAGVTPTRIRQLLLSEELDGYKLGRDWRVSDRAARDWLAGRVGK